jgi:predicted RNA-binding Zn-ribbon protein involved in translation (DUF1610 family)
MNEEKPIQFRAVLGLKQYHCPRCGVMRLTIEPGHVPQIILNASEKGVLVSFCCPVCGDLVQVYAAGESYHSLEEK